MKKRNSISLPDYRISPFPFGSGKAEREVGSMVKSHQSWKERAHKLRAQLPGMPTPAGVLKISMKRNAPRSVVFMRGCFGVKYFACEISIV